MRVYIAHFFYNCVWEEHIILARTMGEAKESFQRAYHNTAELIRGVRFERLPR